MTNERWQVFAPVPARAMRDTTLSALDLRVLAALAAHDRFGANGTGCYASHPRLAALVQCHTKALSRCLGALVGAGYVQAAPHPLNRRLRVYRVLYTDADRAVMESRIGSETATDTASIGNRDFQDVEQIQGDADVNIFPFLKGG